MERNNYYGFIYKTTFPDGKIYIGQTTNFKWKRYFGSGVKLLKHLEKFKDFKISREILKLCNNQKELDKWEKLFIKKFNSTDEKIGLNIQLGGTGRGIFIKDTKDKISASISKTMTNERRKLISFQHKGKVMSKKSKNLISKATTGENNPMYGKRNENSPIFGRKWITNGINCKLVDVSKGIPQGYRLGRK